ncbi:hypothetical protein [Crateriforma spongiae]|uniref:hypothetical protein n=1 Tax=Crateriforma spongiae TaxID=2724528 RepID=UPI00144749E9|nr:hypothetical protein [Crateriforma spongiae]
MLNGSSLDLDESKLLRIAEVFSHCLHDDADRWQYSLPMNQLHEQGFSSDQLSKLVSSNWIEHALEIVSDNASQRRFSFDGSMSFSESSCFALSVEGRRILSGLVTLTGEIARPGSSMHPFAKPVWDDEGNRLTFAGVLVKRYRQPAETQKCVLRAFQSQQWSKQIENPLPDEGFVDRVDQLYETVRSLNRCRIVKLIRFETIESPHFIGWILEPQEQPNKVQNEKPKKHPESTPR